MGRSDSCGPLRLGFRSVLTPCSAIVRTNSLKGKQVEAKFSCTTRNRVNIMYENLWISLDSDVDSVASCTRNIAIPLFCIQSSCFYFRSSGTTTSPAHRYLSSAKNSRWNPRKHKKVFLKSWLMENTFQVLCSHIMNKFTAKYIFGCLKERRPSNSSHGHIYVRNKYINIWLWGINFLKVQASLERWPLPGCWIPCKASPDKESLCQINFVSNIGLNISFGWSF